MLALDSRGYHVPVTVVHAAPSIATDRSPSIGSVVRNCFSADAVGTRFNGLENDVERHGRHHKAVSICRQTAHYESRARRVTPRLDTTAIRPINAMSQATGRLACRAGASLVARRSAAADRSASGHAYLVSRCKIVCLHSISTRFSRSPSPKVDVRRFFRSPILYRYAWLLPILG